MRLLLWVLEVPCLLLLLHQQGHPRQVASQPRALGAAQLRTPPPEPGHGLGLGVRKFQHQEVVSCAGPWSEVPGLCQQAGVGLREGL